MNKKTGWQTVPLDLAKQNRSIVTLQPRLIVSRGRATEVWTEADKWVALPGNPPNPASDQVAVSATLLVVQPSEGAPGKPRFIELPK